MIFVRNFCWQSQFYLAAFSDLYIIDNTLKAFEIGNDHLYGPAPAPALVRLVLYDRSFL